MSKELTEAQIKVRQAIQELGVVNGCKVAEWFLASCMEMQIEQKRMDEIVIAELEKKKRAELKARLKNRLKEIAQALNFKARS